VELTETQLQSFTELYQHEFGIVLSKADAQQKALSLLSFVSLCVPPLEKSGQDDINE